MKHIEENGFLPSFRKFVEDWNHVADEGTELAAFLRDFSVLFSRKMGGRRPQEVREAKFDQLPTLINVLANPLTQAFERGEFCNIWAVAGLGRDEPHNSGILAWLLNKYASHGQRQLFLNKLLTRLKNRLPKDFPRNEWTKAHYTSKREVHPFGGIENRIDVEIDSPECLLFIETKIDALTDREQLVRYSRIAREKSRTRPFVVISLCVANTETINDSENRIISATWNDVAAAINEHVRERQAQQMTDSLATCLHQLAAHWGTLRS